MLCQRCVEHGIEEPLELIEPLGANAISRRDRKAICKACGAAEGLADFVRGMTDQMARKTIEQDRQEAMRLPPGNFWGTWIRFETGEKYGKPNS